MHQPHAAPDSGVRDVSRRRFLAWCATGAAAAAVLAPTPSWATSLGSGKRYLSFTSLHTGEKLNALYYSKGSYLRDALGDINRILRDFRTGDVMAIDLRLLDLLYALQLTLRTRTSFEVISGYRSPATNAMLASASDGVAKKSLHMQGMAIDIRLADRRLSTLREAALRLQAGGVGYYPRPDFVHVDVGRVRSW
jgi:uncharacterized protein YcbK (DUF882 family)